MNKYATFDETPLMTLTQDIKKTLSVHKQKVFKKTLSVHKQKVIKNYKKAISNANLIHPQSNGQY